MESDVNYKGWVDGLLLQTTTDDELQYYYSYYYWYFFYEYYDRPGGKLRNLPMLDKEVNENWLYHGTTKAAAIGIAENDFRLDLTGSNAGTLYGKASQ